ncbi:cyclic nucleotide-binding domain-containing protein [Litorivicinus sp.]|nr:cyclic nucleotide-binding domain-containing protein [Litorivicinus sp.]
MLSTIELLEHVGAYAQECDIRVEDVRGQIALGHAYVITEGSALFLDRGYLTSGHVATQTFVKGDPIGFAEIISKQIEDFEFKTIKPISLVQVDGDRIRKEVDKAGFLAKEIIRYSVARIFGRERGRLNAIFEDRLLAKYRNELIPIRYKKGDTIFNWDSHAGAMFFIEKGSIDLRTMRGKNLATLDVTECFGESSLISGRRRSLQAVAKSDCSLLRLEEDAIQPAMEKEHPLVKLALAQVLKRIHLMNQLRLIKSGDGVFEISVDIEDSELEA